MDWAVDSWTTVSLEQHSWQVDRLLEAVMHWD
jgi:hypothetical protein